MLGVFFVGLSHRKAEFMIGIILVTHGPLGRALLASAEMIIGAQENVHAISLEQEGNLESLQREVGRVARTADTGEGVLLMVDMFGGTPANAVATVQVVPGRQCLCGVNLPMLLEALMQREQMTLRHLTTHVERLACDSVVNLRSAVERTLARASTGEQ